jgi:putative phosphoesterase
VDSLSDVNTPLVTVGVVADTHVPDRVSDLHPGLLPSLRECGVSRIFHAGDVCIRRVLEALESVAPVVAVRGNRDWFFKPPLPPMLKTEIAGSPVALMHGHGNLFTYWQVRFQYIQYGYQFKDYQRLLLGFAPDARVIVFGHTHHVENTWVNGTLMFNPGSASFGFRGLNTHPSFGLLRFYANGKIEGEIRLLPGWRLERGNWVKAETNA